MPKPKISEEDKKEVVPLRLPPAAIAAVDRIAENWGVRKGKEIKRATVARELILIGLGAFQAFEDSPMFVEHAKKQRARQAQISLTNEEEDLITRFHRLPYESQGLIKQLLATTTNTPNPNQQPKDDRYPDEFVMEDREEEELPTQQRKGGRH